MKGLCAYVCVRVVCESDGVIGEVTTRWGRGECEKCGAKCEKCENVCAPSQRIHPLPP